MDIKKNLKEIEKIIGYVFSDKSLLIQAFTRTSFCNEKNYGGSDDYQSNEVLEFFGDSVLSSAIITLLLQRRTRRYRHGITTELGEGDFSNIRSRLSDKRNLARSTEKLGLQKYLLMGEGDEKLGIANEPSVMEDLFESIIGAVYIDCGMDLKTVIGVVSAMLDTSTYLSEEPQSLRSFKNALQEFCADKKRRLPAPVYKTVSESGPDHKKEYERGCYIGERLVATGKGKNQKIADTAAAEAALKILEKEENKEPEHDDTAPTRLRSLCNSKKVSTPEWRDLGEAEESTVNAPVFAIECRALGTSAVGKGASKTEARARAAEAILLSLEGGKEKKAEKKTENKTEKKPHKKQAAKKSAKAEEKLIEIPSANIATEKESRTVKEETKPKKTPSSKRSADTKKKPLWHTKRS